ncbi:MAG: ABC transporter substrate-binding protein [Candidatus Obscuribacterales bacterium]|nr:ABC transporter substrate-binding protein [Candidatus Obscuribacterales bacterium]
MSKSRNTLLISLVSLLVTTGCAQQKSDHASSSVQPSGQGQSNSALPLVNPQSPGPYKTVMFEDAEIREGRFPVGKFGGSLIRPLVGHDPKTFNPWVASDVDSSQLAGLMFSSMLDMDGYSGAVVPGLAAEVKMEPDGLTYTTKLRKGLKWSDGKPITSEDVAFTWNTIIAQGYGNSSLRDITSIDGKSPVVTVVDELTNKYVTPKPFAPFERLLGMAIAPKHIFEPIIKGKDGRAAFQRFWSTNVDPKTLVTNGPYVLSRYVPSQRVEFVPTKNYPMVRDGKRLPYISKLTYLIIPDPNTTLLKFRAKELDLTHIRPRDVVDLIPKQNEENFKLYNLGPDLATSFIMFNMNRRNNPKTNKPYVPTYKSAWFNDTNFRQAVNHALNRQNMVANYLKGVGFPLYTSESSASLFFNNNLKGFPVDLDYSKSLLEKSGFKKHDDGFLYDSTGHKVEFTLIAGSGSSYNEAVGAMIADDLKKLGMKVNLQLINFHTLGDRVESSLDWDACMLGFGGGDPLEPNNGGNVWKSDGRLHLFDLRKADEKGKVTVTDARPWEKRIDELYSLGATTMDKAKRKEYYQEAQKVVYEEAPFIYLVSPMNIMAARNTLGNYDPTPLTQTSDGLHNLEEIYKK